jgi:hypothetical protein
MNHFLAMAAIVKNEGRYLREWIEFHRLMGVEHFYIYDNGSTDNTPEILEPYVRTGLVTATAWPGQVQQLLAYVHPAVAVNWSVFGTGGHVERPTGS